MCGRFDTSHLFWRDIHEQLSKLLPVKTAPVNLEPSADVRPTTNQLTARIEDGEWVLEKMRWGLVPYWRNGKPLKDSAKGAKDGFKLATFNCRVGNFHPEQEGDPQPKPSATFRGAFERRRCIVPANAWFEWTGPEGSKTKHRFARVDDKPIWFAGLWDRCTASDVGEVTSFTIMTGPSAGWLADYHDRAPVVLEEGEALAWLDPNLDAKDLLLSPRAERFRLMEQALR